MPLRIVRNDIAKMKTDVIVNAANSDLRIGGGVCGAIFKEAGEKQLQQECNRIGHCKTGEAVITGGYGLPAKHIIHAVGPIWQGGGHDEARLLHNSYTSSLELALKHKCESIAFPLISSGIYGYPKDQALQIAISAIGEFLLKHDIDVYLVVFDKNAYTLSEKLFFAIERYIDDNYVDEHLREERSRNMPFSGYRPEPFSNEKLMQRSSVSEDVFKVEEPHEEVEFYVIDESYGMERSCAPDSVGSLKQKHNRSLEDAVSKLDETFSQMLLRLIDEKGMSDVDTYKRANIDRRLFSKIRSKNEYSPSKSTAIALSIALMLSLDETLDLLGSAGYTLSHSSKFDVIIEYFIQEGNYNIFEINEVLFAFEQDLLGA
jgi:O-acetyl-ADP-ribose deacetylase (regulator of RNase III)